MELCLLIQFANMPAHSQQPFRDYNSMECAKAALSVAYMPNISIEGE